jgi:integrase
MQTENSSRTTPKRTPWNKGKLTGPKPPLRAKNVWSIRTKLQVEGRPRHLAMFNFAIDSKLRACDLVRIKVEDVAPHGVTLDRVTVRQKKTGQPVRFEMTDQTRQSIDDYITVACKKPSDFLFASCRSRGRCISTRQYARIVSTWIAGIGLDARDWREMARGPEADYAPRFAGRLHVPSGDRQLCLHLARRWGRRSVPCDQSECGWCSRFQRNRARHRNVWH